MRHESTAPDVVPAGAGPDHSDQNTRHHTVPASHPFASWEKWSGGFVKTDSWLETLYNDLTGKKGEFIKHN